MSILGTLLTPPMELSIHIKLKALKGNNDLKVLATLATLGCLTTAQISRSGALAGQANTRMAIQSALRKGWVRRTGSRPTRGRPSTIYGITKAGLNRLDRMGVVSFIDFDPEFLPE